jgi:lipopolysaccharide export LptBFGC system permease protein LptF
MFAGLVFVFAVVAGAREGGEPLEASVWLRVLALQMPRVLSFTLPMALLYACVKAFSELSERGELVALSAAGQGWPRVMRAPLLLGALAGLGALFLQEWAVPRSEQARRLVLQSAAQSRARSGFQMTHTDSGTGSGDGFRQIVNARTADFARALLHAPVVKELRPDGSLRRQIVATRGHWDDRAANMIFEGGWVLELPAFSVRAKGVKIQVRPFERLEVRGFPPPERWSGVRTLREMIAAGQFEALSLSELQAERAMTSRQARSIVPRSESPRSDALVPTLTFAIHDRLAAPLVCVALVLIGCPLGVRAPRAPSISPLGRALMVLLVYFAVWLTASYFGKSGAPIPLLWAYLPLLLLIGAGLALLRRTAL